MVDLEIVSVFTSGHCAGTVAGTVRALCGHCAGIVRQCIICSICSTCLLGGQSNEQQASAAAGTGSAAFAIAAAEDFRLACRVHGGFARAEKLSCHFSGRLEIPFVCHGPLTQACKWSPSLHSYSTDLAFLSIGLWMDGAFLLTCLANFLAHSCSASAGKHVRRDSPNSAQQGGNNKKKVNS